MSLQLPDGIDEIRSNIPDLIAIIARTARWVNPETFRQLPVWYPNSARRLPLYDKTWTNIRKLGGKAEKTEGNSTAQKALYKALGIATRQRPRNWSTCHIWGYDDPTYATPGNIVRNPRYFSCLANMVKGGANCDRMCRLQPRTNMPAEEPIAAAQKLFFLVNHPVPRREFDALHHPHALRQIIDNLAFWDGGRS